MPGVAEETEGLAARLRSDGAGVAGLSRARVGGVG